MPLPKTASRFFAKQLCIDQLLAMWRSLVRLASLAVIRGKVLQLDEGFPNAHDLLVSVGCRGSFVRSVTSAARYRRETPSSCSVFFEARFAGIRSAWDRRP